MLYLCSALPRRQNQKLRRWPGANSVGPGKAHSLLDKTNPLIVGGIFSLTDKAPLSPRGSSSADRPGSRPVWVVMLKLLKALE